MFKSTRFQIVLLSATASVLSCSMAGAQPKLAPQPPRQLASVAPAPARSSPLLTAITLADIGFGNGLRFANLGGRREVFVPLPQGADATADELVLVLDDVSAHEARRNLAVMVNDRVVSAISLDGHSMARAVRVPLAKTKAKDGFLKLTFVYSGAATQDRCIDVRAIGDGLVIRPESALEVDVGPTAALDVTTTVALMPREVSILLPGRRLSSAEIAAALTVARSLAVSGRRATFVQGAAPPELSKAGETRHWIRGLVIVGQIDDAVGLIDAPLAVLAGPVQTLGTIAAVRVGGMPALLVSDVAAARAAGLLASTSLAATRGLPAATVGDSGAPQLPTDRVSFDQLGVPPVEADVFGRADLELALNTRDLPAGRQPERLLLDLMIAPDGDGDRAVISAYVNEQLLGSKLAAIGDTTHMDLELPSGLVGTSLNVRALVQRRSALGDCRFEPQGYPARILGSSGLVLAAANARASDFSDLAAHWMDGVEILLPEATADRPLSVIGSVAEFLNAISPVRSKISVSLVPANKTPTPSAPFLAVGDVAPLGVAPRVRFDRGRVAVADLSGRTLLDLGGFAAGAVAQVVTAGELPGIWIKSLASDGSLQTPSDLRLDHGDVAFLDRTGVALAMSTERDTLVKISYPEQVSWLTIADRFRPWIIGGLWLMGTVMFLFGLQRLLHRRQEAVGE
ncbi:MAG: cellulose biosynthesis cyclic di-GMP-binding regulatory protein BcsB [Xanthobacteraceae bacterium]